MYKRRRGEFTVFLTICIQKDITSSKKFSTRLRSKDVFYVFKRTTAYEDIIQSMTVRKQSNLISFMAFMYSEKAPCLCKVFDCEVWNTTNEIQYYNLTWNVVTINRCQWHCSIVIISRSQDHAPSASLPSCSGSLDPCPTCQWEPGLQGRERSPTPKRQERLI